MPAVFSLAALQQSQSQSQGLPQAAKPGAQATPPGQARFAPGTAANGTAIFGNGAPMATGAVLAPSGFLPIPAPAPVVSTSQTGQLAAAAINGLDRAPQERRRNAERPGPPQRTGPVAGAGGADPAPRGIPGGPAPAAEGGTPAQARRAYRASRFAL